MPAPVGHDSDTGQDRGQRGRQVKVVGRGDADQIDPVLAFGFASEHLVMAAVSAFGVDVVSGRCSEQPFTVAAEDAGHQRDSGSDQGTHLAPTRVPILWIDLTNEPRPPPNIAIRTAVVMRKCPVSDGYRYSL